MQMWYYIYMTYVSTRPLSKEVLKHIGDLLIVEIYKAKTMSQANKLVGALLTDSERIMLAKRFAVIVLLNKGASYRYIQNVLKVSLSTVFRIQKLRKSGVFDDLIKYTHRKKIKQKNRNKSNYNKETAFEVLIRAGLPPMGKGRWRAFYERTDYIAKNKHTK